MIYATEQQVVVTSVAIVAVALVALFVGIIYGRRRGLEEAAEEQRWEREEAKARRTHPVYRQPQPRTSEAAHEELLHPQYWETVTHGQNAWLPADETVLDPTAAETLGEEWDRIHPGWREQTVLQPTAVLTPEEMSWTGEIQRMTAAFEEDMARIMGGTDQQLREITR